MRNTSHWALVIAVMSFLGITLFIFLTPGPVPRKPDTSLPLFQTMRYPTTVEKLASTVALLRDPFQSMFFETAQFKGISRNSQGIFSAIFLDASNRFLVLPTGQSSEGITVMAIGSHTCRIMVGSTSRDLMTQTK